MQMMTPHEMEGREEKVQVRNQHFLMETAESGQVVVCCQGKRWRDIYFDTVYQPEVFSLKLLMSVLSVWVALAGLYRGKGTKK